MSLRYLREPWEISLEYTPSWEFCSLSPAAHPQQGTLGIIRVTARSLATLWAPDLTWVVHLSALLGFYQRALGHQSCGPKTRKASLYPLWCLSQPMGCPGARGLQLGLGRALWAACCFPAVLTNGRPDIRLPRQPQGTLPQSLLSLPHVQAAKSGELPHSEGWTINKSRSLLLSCSISRPRRKGRRIC